MFGLADNENVQAKPVQYIPPPPPMVPLSSIPYRLPGMSFISCLYRVGKKTGPQAHDHNFVNS